MVFQLARVKLLAAVPTVWEHALVQVELSTARAVTCLSSAVCHLSAAKVLLRPIKFRSTNLTSINSHVSRLAASFLRPLWPKRICFTNPEIQLSVSYTHLTLP